MHEGCPGSYSGAAVGDPEPCSAASGGDPQRFLAHLCGRRCLLHQHFSDASLSIQDTNCRRLEPWQRSCRTASESISASLMF